MKFLSDYTNMQIHTYSPISPISVEDAATKIQAGFRGYRVRKQLKENACRTPTSGDQYEAKENCENIQQNSNIIAAEPNGRRISDDGDTDVVLGREDKCATKIQAGVRGFLVRKKQKAATTAATKIQAGFRGFRARKELKKLKA